MTFYELVRLWIRDYLVVKGLDCVEIESYNDFTQADTLYGQTDLSMMIEIRYRDSSGKIMWHVYDGSFVDLIFDIDTELTRPKK